MSAKHVPVRSIWKYELPITDHFSIPMPAGARVLTAQMQNGEPMVWAEVEPGQPREPVHFYIVGTGNPFPQGVALEYVATFQQRSFVWHLYQEYRRRS